MAGHTITISPRARQSYLALFSIKRRFTTSTSNSSSSGQFHRSDFSGQGFTGYYDAGAPTVGPLADAYGAPRITPKVLKQHLDSFVIGQERAKKVLSVAVYNHYQRIQELERREEEEEEMLAQQARREFTRHPVEDEFPGQQPTVNIFPTSPSASSQTHPSYAAPDFPEHHTATIEKSNVLLLGPSGVGKTLMAKTLARVLEVPFSMSDCTPFTQAGYIGEDVEVCVQRLLAAANYDVTQAERGIICLDEIDKIATAKVSHGKDVSGEGVQQALLKIIEGTTVQVQAKQEKNSGHPPNNTGARSPNAVPTSGYPAGASPLGGGAGNFPPSPGKGEIYNVNTDNILFIFTGAFVGLHKTVMDRLAKGSMGFGARIRSASGLSSTAAADSNDPTIRNSGPEIDDLFRKHLPFYTAALTSSSTTTTTKPTTASEPTTYNTLDLTEPADLQKYGLIPELIGRIPITCALSSLSTSALVRVLTEPRNALLAQYTQLFALSGVELHFSAAALHEVAKAASGMGTGARGLRTVMERLLGESMFEVPGSGMRYVAVTGKAARKEEAVRVFARQGHGELLDLMRDEEDEWEWRQNGGKGVWRRVEDGETGSFEEYREKVKVAGTG